MEIRSGAEGSEREIPSFKWEDYIRKMEEIDFLVDPHRAGRYDTVGAEFYGKIEDWEEDTHNFVHDLVTARMGLMLQTKASLDDAAPGKRYLNTPEAVEQYVMVLRALGHGIRIHINTTDPELAREIHKSFFGVLMESRTIEDALNRFALDSRYGKMRSTIDANFPLVDIMSIHERKNAAQSK